MLQHYVSTSTAEAELLQFERMLKTTSIVI